MNVLVATVTFLLLDGLWLGVIAKKLYRNAIGPLMRMSNGTAQPLWGAAVVVYIALIMGILLFVIPKANGSWLAALMWGGIFGFVTYATYDFTNLATLSNWPLKMSIIDVLWGMFLCGVTSTVTVLLTSR